MCLEGTIRLQLLEQAFIILSSTINAIPRTIVNIFLVSVSIHVQVADKDDVEKASPLSGSQPAAFVVDIVEKTAIQEGFIDGAQQNGPGQGEYCH